MKKFISLFIVVIFLLAFVIGQCNDPTEEDESEMTSLYYSTDKDEEGKEDVVASTHVKQEGSEKNILLEQSETTEKEFEDKDGIDLNGIVLLPPKIPSQLLCRSAYNLSYNKETLCPNWVAWHLTAEHTDGPFRRLGNFHEDENVPAPRATNSDYRGSGWSRGHMCPAGDNKWDEEAMFESFSLVNVCPQDASLNSGLWNSIEIDCRNWAKRFQDIYIVCGPVFYKQEHERIGSNEVCVPEAFFKVVLCLNGVPKGMGFIVKNNAGTKKKDLYYNSIDQVERVTGFDFFPVLPDELEDEVESKLDMNLWK